MVHWFYFLHAQHAYGWPSEPPFHEIVPSENDTMRNQPKEDTNFGSMLKGPYFVRNFPRGEEIEIFLDDIGFFNVERAPWRVSPSQNVLSWKNGDFHGVGQVVPGLQIHVGFNVQVLSCWFPATSVGIWKVVLPIICHFCYPRLGIRGAEGVNLGL